MRISTLLVAFVSSRAIGTATQQTDDAGLVQRLKVPGASLKAGFAIPDNVADDAYSVRIDESGIEHNTRHANLDLDLEERDLRTEAASPRILLERQRDPIWVSTCQGSPNSLNRTDADAAIRLMKRACGDSRDVLPGEHLFLILNHIAIYFCNYSTTGETWPCSSHLIELAIQERISEKCGKFMGGWSKFGERRFTIGYELMRDSNNSFCHRNH